MGEDKWQVLNAASEKHSRAKNKAIDGQQSRIVVRYEERGTLWDPLQSSHIGSVVGDDNVFDEIRQPPDTAHVPLIEPIGVVPQRARISSGGVIHRSSQKINGNRPRRQAIRPSLTV